MGKRTFQPYGPYKIDLPKGRRAIDDRDRNAFWQKVGGEVPGLPDAVGCYIFAIRAGKGVRPWYVGKAEKTPFKREVWNPRNLNIYNRVLWQVKKGTPLLYLLARETQGGKFRKKTASKISDLRFLEELLIGACLTRNKDLENKLQTKFLREVSVPGYMNSDTRGKPPKPVSALRRLLED